MPDNRFEIIAAQNSASDLAGDAVILAAIVLCVYQMTSEYVINACELGDIIRAHCCVYGAGFIMTNVRMLLLFLLTPTHCIVKQARMLIISTVFVTGSIALLCFSFHHGQRALVLPACKRALSGALAFAWYTYAPLNLLCAVSHACIMWNLCKIARPEAG